MGTPYQCWQLDLPGDETAHPAAQLRDASLRSEIKAGNCVQKFASKTDAYAASISMMRPRLPRHQEPQEIDITWMSQDAPAAGSLCDHVTNMGTLLVVHDIYSHPLLSRSASTKHSKIAAFVGAPIRDNSGRTIGVASLSATKIQRWTPSQIQSVLDAAAAAGRKRYHARSTTEQTGQEIAYLEPPQHNNFGDPLIG